MSIGIFYASAKGHTKTACEYLAGKLGAQLVEVKDAKAQDFAKFDVIIVIAKDEVGNVITQSVVALAVAVQMSGCLDTELVKRVMLSKVPKKVYAENEKAYELGLKYAEICIKNDK